MKILKFVALVALILAVTFSTRVRGRFGDYAVSLHTCKYTIWKNCEKTPTKADGLATNESCKKWG